MKDSIEPTVTQFGFHTRKGAKMKPLFTIIVKYKNSAPQDKIQLILGDIFAIQK